MNETVFDKKKVVKYLVWTFALAYAIQAGVWLLYRRGHIISGQLVMACMMFVPTLGVFFAGQSLKGMGWRPGIKKNIRPFLAAWLAPAVLTVAGALLYFLVFPGHFDMSGSYIALTTGSEALEQMRGQGVSYGLYVVISAVCAVTYAPLINCITGLGEEIGWRGFLYPQLKARFGYRKGAVLGGIIWGAWHWPLIYLIDYEYGAAAGNNAGYFGFPVTGMLLFCVFTVSAGIICDRLYEKSGSIWFPSVFHGAINAAAALPLAVCMTDTGSARLLGPAPNGLIAGLPLIIIAAVFFIRKNEEGRVAQSM
ncbi:MAG: CPBP family intramembrane metalloprotease [Clostridia bacterium]|nr:CPBP family intramembrane metalloprotease [Clostridia bacterium]